jgi:hypothetical protein
MSCSVVESRTGSEEAYHTTGCALGFCLAEHLIAKSLDIVHVVGNDDGIGSQIALDCRRQSSSGIFFASRSTIYIALKSQVLIVQVVDLEFRDACVFGRRDLLCKVVF